MMMNELIMKCFHARTNAHVLHLNAKTYAIHIALNEFYDEVIEIADRLAEAYQGSHGLLGDMDFPYEYTDTPKGLLEDLEEWIIDNRDDCYPKGDTYLANITDELLALIRGTQYKIKFLK
jgi:hypothetical protein